MKEQIFYLLSSSIRELAQTDSVALPDELQFIIERPRDAKHGDFSSNIAMIYCKNFKMSPAILAQKIVESITLPASIKTVAIAGPGFINFTVNQELLAHQLELMWRAENCGILQISTVDTVVVDYSSPNLAKEMHVGHLRSTIIGDCVARILAIKGYRVVRQNHVGDWGTQFGMLLAHFEEELRERSGEIQLNDLETFYKAAKLRFDADAQFAERARQLVVALQSGNEHCLAMWQEFIGLSLAHCQEIYSRLGVTLSPADVRAESFYNADLPVIIRLLEKQGLLVSHAGAQCVFMEEFKGKEGDTLPVIVRKKDGGFLYASTDLAAIRYRNEQLNAHRVLYVVDARQSLHFQQVFALAKKAGFAKKSMQLEHISFGMVLDKSGKPFKSRDGGVTKLIDLLNEAERRAAELIAGKQTHQLGEVDINDAARIIGIAALKYADLSKHRTSDYIFDWDTMLCFEGNTAPYLLYAYTRIKSLFTKAAQSVDDLSRSIMFPTAVELSLAKHVALFPETIDIVCHKAVPHLLCTYLYELAGLFSSFYESCPILAAEDEELRLSRLKLCALTAKVLKLGLQLLGIETLERM